MTLSTKILLSIIVIFLLGIGGFIIYKQLETARKIDDIQNSVIEQKQLLDNITRANSQYVSKEDLEAYAKQQNINLEIIKKDLKDLNASIIAINGITVISQGQNNTNIPSTNTTPRSDHPGNITNDPYGYLANTQHLTLNEKFSNVEVPFGTVSFSAFREKPWDVNVAERKYIITSVLAQKVSGQHVAYSKFAIKSGDKTYDVQIDDNKFVEEYPSPSFSFNPKLYAMVNGGVGVSKTPIKAEFTPGVAFGFFSYGKTKSNPDLSIAQVGIGYGVVDHTLEFSLSPIQYNIGQHLSPIISNTYIGPVIQGNTKGNITPGVGLTVGF